MSKNVPNLITTIRFFLVPLFIAVFFSSNDNSLLYATLIFIIAGITDMLDGYIARTYNLITKLGTVLDPLADKTMQLTVLICFTVKEYLPIWVIAIIGIKEILMIIGGLFLYYYGKETVIPASKFGKVATMVFYITIIFIALELSSTLSFIFIVMTLFLTITAFINYFIGFTKVSRDFKK